MWEEWVVKVYVPSTLLSVLWSNSTYGAAVVLVWGRCVELKPAEWHICECAYELKARLLVEMVFNLLIPAGNRWVHDPC